MNPKKYKILIVDDNAINTELLEEIFTPMNFSITSYTNPVKAYEETRNAEFDLLLLDVIMPKMDGFEFAEKFCVEHPDTPIAFISAHGSPENKVKGYNLGSHAYIEKPFDIQTIKAQVKGILKLKESRDYLLCEKEKMDRIFEFSDDEIILADNNFNIFCKNYRFLPKQKDIGTNFIDVLEEYNQKDIIKKVTEFANSDKKSLLTRIEIDEYCTSTNFSKIFNKQGDMIGYLIIIRDITEIKRLELQKEEFIATLTHDLKTPVRAETRMLKMLLDEKFGKLQPDQRDIIQEIWNSSKFMGRMTDNILLRYKIDNGTFQIIKEQNSLKKTLQECAEDMVCILEEKNQTLKINFNIENEKFVYDKNELKRVILNILINASEYSNENEVIEISAVKNKNHLEIKIKDNGMGIPPQEISTIFDEYHAGLVRFKKVGSGLSLFVAKSIMEAHDGTIDVESTPGKGSTFTISLPYEKIPSKVN